MNGDIDFKVLTLDQSSSFSPLPNTLLIRIFDSHKKDFLMENNPLKHTDEFSNILIYEFDDIDLSYNPFAGTKKSETELIFENVIRTLKNYVISVLNSQNIEHIVVHCLMGNPVLLLFILEYKIK